ncbi:MAG TPA: Smr/MutS family protein [Firmicutes bacterium]|nr:Smr/MutS family protein [Bacillota bacterium]
MCEIDLHGMKTSEALEYFIWEYNGLLAKESHTAIRVIHGWGSSGVGGDTRKAIRSLLQGYSTYLDFVPGEDIDGNPGYTVVYPKHRLPANAERVWDSIVEFCDKPRTQNEIVRKFVHRVGEAGVMKALRELTQRGRLRSFYKESRKHFIADHSSKR